MLNAFSKKGRKILPWVAGKEGAPSRVLRSQVGGASSGRTPKILPTKRATFGSPWRIILNVLLIFVVSQVVAVFFVELFLSLLHPHANLSNLLDQSAPAQFSYILIAESLAVALVLFVIRRRGLELNAIGLGRKPTWRDLKKAAIGFAVFYGLLILATLVISALIPSFNTNQAQDVGFNSLNSTLDGILAFASLVILPPLGEETLIRGYLYSGLRARWKFVPAMLVTSLIFGLAHLQLGSGAAALYAAGLDTFVLSVVLVYLRESTGALYAGMLVHSLNNVVAFGVHFHGIIF
jgi:membrane protease YdiL (CAAX protease family)